MQVGRCLIVALFVAVVLGQNSTNATSGNTTTPTDSPTATFIPDPRGTVAPEPNASAVNITALPACPFSRWQGDPRYCYECRWCPFRESTCCEMEDEIEVLKSVNVSGSDDWDCFITIVHFQQCGRCSPSAKAYIQQKQLDWVWDPRGLSIKPCKKACKYIYNQCNGATLLNGEPVIPAGASIDDVCGGLPEADDPSNPNARCYDAASWVSVTVTVAAVLLMVFIGF